MQVRSSIDTLPVYLSFLQLSLTLLARYILADPFRTSLQPNESVLAAADCEMAEPPLSPMGSESAGSGDIAGPSS